MLSASPIPSDMREFFTWCAQTARAEALDKTQVIAMFGEKINSKELQVQDLPPDGFSFLTELFIE